MIKQNKKLLLLVSAIIISCLYIFVANRVITKDNIKDTGMGEYDVYRAKIIEIISEDVTTYDLGSQVAEGKIIYFNVKILDGDLKGEIKSVKQEISPFFAIQPKEITLGDKILISQSFNSEIIDENSFDMLEYVRTDGIIILVLIFAGCLIWYGRSKGFLTMISLTLTCASIFLVFIPSILNGYNIYVWSIQICIFIIVMTLSIVNGFNLKSLSAGLGCTGGVLVAGIITILSQKALKITGMVDEQSVFLQMLNPDKPIDLKAIIFAAIIIGAVGAIMDVSISIASSLNEIKDQNPEISFKNLYTSGINIGKDIMGTMTNTLILAYIGSSLAMVLLLISNTASMSYLLNTESIIIELLQSIVGSLGILLTLPLTSLISSFLYTKK